MFFTNNNGCEFLFAVDYFLYRSEIATVSAIHTTASTNIRNDEGKTKGTFLLKVLSAQTLFV